jgi:Domain of unknown function (DUF4365)
LSEIIRRRRTKQHIDGDRAVHDIERVVLERGFALERTTVDYGTDFTLHVFEDDGEYIGYLIGQSRARSGLQANRDGSYSLAVDLGHLAQWATQLSPFLLVLYDTDRSMGYWYYVQANRERLERSFARRGARQSAMMLRFDPAKRLDVAALDTFRRWVVQLQDQAKDVMEFREDA